MEPEQPHPDGFSLDGMPPEKIALYWQCLAINGGPVEEVARALRLTREELLEEMEGMPWPEALWIEDEFVHVVSPHQVMAQFLRDQAETVARAGMALAGMAQVMPQMMATMPAPVDLREPIDGQVIDPLEAQRLRGLGYVTARTRIMVCQGGEWRTTLARAEEAELLAQARARGVWARSLFAKEAALEARSLLEVRAAHGEEIRIIPEVPHTLMVVDDFVGLRVKKGGALNRIVHTEEPALVEACVQIFESMWTEGVPLERFEVPRLSQVKDAVQFLRRMRAGEKDEQIARAMDISVRSVRRRVADIMLELGAETRFQAGVEAARRGWL